ncbi:two-component sensor histidine kinase (plasmid) [Methylosinus sp. C49]|uniref:sensor histidine kinase n=1 Tax=Methylosinus sp. C49 TaxID=2699395 RepID=UPI001367484A|nr:HAMP domain-containing sensor histidine kinase [Methylosinus sp. C49]BBU63852.1 two-component sensor histidine kinase [Methylosinus sp. C49]
MRRRSLALRLMIYLAITQIAGTLLLVPIVDFLVSVSGVLPGWEISRDDWGEHRLQALVARSLTRDEAGAARLEPTPELRAYLAENPLARYAAFDCRSGALPGSSPELVQALSGLDRLEAASLKFRLAGDGDARARGALRRMPAGSAACAIAAYGYRFAWSDLHAVSGLFLTLHSAIVIAPAVLIALAIAWLVVRRGLAPLRAAAADVAAIDMDTLHKRLGVDDAPKEIAPFVEAVNDALGRLDAGVAAQRRFTANAAHELRTPIAIMRAHADNPDDAAFRCDMKRDIRRVQTIVEQLLATARFSIREAPADVDIDLGEAVLAIVADYTPLMIENGRRIAFEPPSTPTIARGDKWALECVVANLLDNALRAEPPGGVVDVRVLPSAIVEIADHGAGVSDADRDRIFEPFWRRDAKGHGTGLGLAISKTLAELMGGSISIVETCGGGATFRIALRKSRAPQPIRSSSRVEFQRAEGGAEELRSA